MLNYCCSKPQTEQVSEKDMDKLTVRIDEMNKQISNIYDLLEVLTNESKSKFNLNNYNNVPKENDDKSKQTYFLDKTAV